VIAVVPLNQHGCIVTISLDGATMDNDLYYHPFAQLFSLVLWSMHISFLFNSIPTSLHLSSLLFPSPLILLFSPHSSLHLSFFYIRFYSLSVQFPPSSSSSSLPSSPCRISPCVEHRPAVSGRDGSAEPAGENEEHDGTGNAELYCFHSLLCCAM
jgi:hypothetical protein